MNKDFFGDELHVGQRVLHVTRRGSTTFMEVKMVGRIDEAGDVWVQAPPNSWSPNTLPRLARLVYPERLVIHPEDRR